ncbi:hypothetical protein PA25_08440 [Pseudoalteromonas sp. A25]|uniref:hypothetical protein n=1 Tax=Pseudoalteromonas sp. A25 TaxID=116092 RepID=UPI0012606F7E|nr:hypothetical protein [Pseudoalteromonas sp. A25]BBN80859.1 hypothetical protein PA25_08440 [Pseudoalteromonas sp. A25]
MKIKYILLLISATLILLSTQLLHSESKSSLTSGKEKTPYHQHAITQPPEALKTTNSPPEKQQSAVEPNSTSTTIPAASPQQIDDVYIPPIGKHTTSTSYQGDLSDYESYQAYGDQQERELKQAFIIAAKDKVKRLQALIERGREQGISEEELKFAESKVNGIMQMSEKLEQELANTK